MSSLLLVLLLAGDAKFAQVPDPACPGGTTLQTSERGSDFVKFCAKRDGQREGPFVNIWSTTGTVQQKGSYHNGVLHGGWSKWDEKGTLREQGEYREGNRFGWWVTFHATGKKATAGEYGHDQQERGLWTWWDDQGKKLEEGEYRDSKKHGLWTTYDPKTGKVLKQIEYSNGVERTR